MTLGGIVQEAPRNVLRPGTRLELSSRRDEVGSRSELFVAAMLEHMPRPCADW
jgi:hypothetical protein